MHGGFRTSDANTIVPRFTIIHKRKPNVCSFQPDTTMVRFEDVLHHDVFLLVVATLDPVDAFHAITCSNESYQTWRHLLPGVIWIRLDDIPALVRACENSRYDQCELLAHFFRKRSSLEPASRRDCWDHKMTWLLFEVHERNLLQRISTSSTNILCPPMHQ
jgi:hypothetical protein